MSTAYRSNKLAAFAGLLCFAASPLLADDTELYVGSNSVSTVWPNIVFVIDTSGSMDNKVVTQDPYDSGKTYPGNCDPDKIYWGKSNAPGCDTKDYWFDASANRCKKAESTLDVSGYFQDRMIMWNHSAADFVKEKKRKWTYFYTFWKDHFVECQADRGEDGDGSGANPWPANYPNGPWTADSGKEVDWEATGKVYTLYSGNYLNWYHYASADSTKTRLEVVQEVLSTLVDTTNNVNIALMRYNTSGSGGYFLTPMLPLNDTLIDDPNGGTGKTTSRAYFKNVINTLPSPAGNTPLAETFYEAALYFRGEKPQFGTGSHKGVLNGGFYKSPMTYECQKNFIVYLTDGDPTGDSEADTAIQSLPGFADVTDGFCKFDATESKSDDCLEELAGYLKKSDQRSNLNGDQDVVTFTIGFHTDQKLLQEAAHYGGGEYYRSDNSINLLAAFQAIVAKILEENTTFAAPAVTVNAFNRLTHRSELYFALFRPSTQPFWTGNFKRYRLGGSPLVVRDVKGNAAVDTSTGFFKPTSQSFWNEDLTDGNDVAKGGAASKLALPRKVYTNISNGALAVSVNELSETNAALNDPASNCTTVGLPASCTSEELRDVLKWARGVDLFDDDKDGDSTDIRPQMGDPLHTQPVLMTYGKGEHDLVLFGSTNEGYLHAIDTFDGTEVFAFMPKPLLRNLYTLYEGDLTEPHRYGMDGPIALWVDDISSDGTIEGSDRARLYASMRRGGRNIYALDITQRDAPSLIWTIEGGAGKFAELGQTWSRPIVAKVKLAGDKKTVLIFGGGYDEGQDNTSATDDVMGRAIFMVDAVDGTLLWQAGQAGADLVLPEMTNSIPSEVRVVDVNANGIADRMYVGDMGGRLWRFDIKEDNKGASDFATGGVIATLGQVKLDMGDETGEAHHRRFYYPPDVSFNKDTNLLNIAIGSGYRAHPLNSVIRDRFFVLHDTVGGKETYTAWDKDNLYNFEEHPKGCDEKNGFYIELDNPTTGAWQGEKVLAEALTLNHHVYFTTFTPVASAVSCSPSQGTGTLYNVEIPNPLACTEIEDGDKTWVTLPIPTIPPTPQLVCTDEGCTILVGPQATDPPSDAGVLLKDYWRKR